MAGAITHIIKKRFTSVFLKIFLAPRRATPMPMIAPAFNCTNDVGIPLVTDAKSKSVAVTNEMMASKGPKRNKPFPVLFSVLRPSSDAPMAKVWRNYQRRKNHLKPFPSMGSFNSFTTIDATGPAALATLLAPIEKATYWHGDDNTFNNRMLWELSVGEIPFAPNRIVNVFTCQITGTNEMMGVINQVGITSVSNLVLLPSWK